MTTRMTRRRAALTGAALATGLVLASCSTGEGVDVTGDGQTTEPGAETSGEVLVAAIGGEPDQLDPHNTSAYFSFQVLENVFDTLVEPGDDLTMQPALAESWEVSEDQLTWTFDIRDGVTFHDGSPLTSEDVVYSYNRIITEELGPSWRFSAVESVTAPDEDTVVIEVSAPAPNLLANLGGFKGLAIVQQENVESGEIGRNPIGTGPFSFASYASGESIELTANPDYWDGAPALAGLEFRFIPEPSTAIAALRAGDVHWTDSVPPQQVAELSGDGDLELGQVGSNDYWYLAFNQAREPFDDARVRQAIAYALDRDAITQATMYGNATVNQLAIPESSQWYVPFEEFSLDLAQAQSLMDDAGVSDLEVDFMVSSDYPETVTAAQVIAAQLGEIGVTVTIRQLDFGSWLDEQGQGNFDMLMMGWLGNIDPDDFYYGQHHSQGSNNYQGFANDEVDSLLDAGRVETDEDARRDLYGDAATIIAQEVSYLYLYNPDVVQVWSPAVTGYDVRGDRAIRFRDAVID